MFNRMISFGLALALFVSSPVSVFAGEDTSASSVETIIDNNTEAKGDDAEDNLAETDEVEEAESKSKAETTDSASETIDSSEMDDLVNTDSARAGVFDSFTEAEDDEEDEDIELSDSENLVRITAKESILNGAVKVSVKEITKETDEAQYNEMADVLDTEAEQNTTVVDFVAYDITLYNEDNEEVEPTGEVKVEFTKPAVDGLTDDTLTTEVYHYEDTSINKMSEVTPSSYSVEMVTDHFSTYIIAIKGYRTGNIFESKYVTVKSEKHDWKYSDTFPEMYEHPGYANHWNEAYYYTKLNGTDYKCYFPLELRVYVNNSAQPVETFSHAYFVSNNPDDRDNFEINAEDYVIESVKYGYGKYYNKDNMAIQNDSGTTYNLGFYNYLTTNQRSNRNNIYYPINPEKNINYIDIYLKDNNLNIYSVQNATLIDYKDFFKAATININGQTYDAFNFSRNGGTNDTAGNEYEGNNYHENSTVYQGLASQKYNNSFKLADSIHMTKELFPTIDKVDSNYDAAAYNVNVQFVTTDDGYYVIDSDKYGYDLVQDTGDSAIGSVTNHATLKVKSDTEGGFWPFAPSGYHFGMQIPLDFAISPNGKTLVNGQEKDTVFEFSGDDDVFVYIDNDLVLDLGGIHGKVAGSINFATGMVHVDGDDYVGYGDNNRINLRDKDFSFYEKLGTTREEFSKKSHTMHVVYFERGASQSNCMIKYNFVPINNKKTFSKELTIQKEWDDSNYLANRPKKLQFNVYGTYSDEGNVKYVDLAGNSHDKKEDAIVQISVTSDEDWKKTINEVPIFFKNDTRKKISWSVEEVIPEDYEQTGYEKWYSETTDITKEDLIPQPASVGGEKYSHFDIEVNAVSDDNSVGARFIESIRDLDGKENHVSILGYYEGNNWIARTKSVAMSKHNNYEWRAANQTIGKNTVITFYVKYSGRTDYKLVIIDKNSYYPDGAKYYWHETEFKDDHEPFRNLAIYYTGKKANPKEGYVDLSGKNLFTTGMVECPTTVSDGYGYARNTYYGYYEPGIDLVLSPKTIESVSIEATGDEHYKFTNTATAKTSLTFKKIVDGENPNTEGLYSIKLEKVTIENGQDKTELVNLNNNKVFIGENEIKNAVLSSEQYGVVLGVGHGDGIYNIWADQTVTITGLPVGTYRLTEVGAYNGVELGQFDTSIVYDGNLVKGLTADIECGNGDKYVEIHNKVKQTFDWKLKKVSATLNTKALSGAKFSLISKDKKHKYKYYGISGEDGYVNWYTSDGFAEDTKVNSIEDGKYILKETVAPTGYAKSDEEWTVEIKKYKHVTVKNGDNIIAKTDKDKPTVEVAFENTVAYTLPETGGRGIYVYTIGGILLMIAGALLLYKNKNNKNK